MNVQCGAPRLCFYRLDVEAELDHVREDKLPLNKADLSYFFLHDI